MNFPMMRTLTQFLLISIVLTSGPTGSAWAKTKPVNGKKPGLNSRSKAKSANPIRLKPNRKPAKPVAKKPTSPVAAKKPVKVAIAPKPPAPTRKISYVPPPVKVIPPKPKESGVLGAVNYEVTQAAGVYCHVVDIDPKNPNVQMQCVRAEDLGHTRMTFASLVNHHKPLAAITGTFFDVESGTIICNLVQQGKLLNAGHHGNTIALDGQQQPKFLDTANRAGHECSWKNIDFAVSCGPTLVSNGRIVLDPPSENFRDPGLFRQASRAAIAIKPNGHMLFVTCNHGVTLGKFAKMMQDLGVSYAINLDGGSSTGLYVRGKYPSRPARSMTNLLMVSMKPGSPMPSEITLEAEAANAEANLPSTTVDEADVIAPLPQPVQLFTEPDDCPTIRIPPSNP